MILLKQLRDMVTNLKSNRFIKMSNNIIRNCKNSFFIMGI